MADPKKKNTRTVGLLLVVVGLVLFFTWPFDGTTGYQWLQTKLGAAPATAPTTTPVNKASPQSQSQEIVIEGRPTVEDGARNAQPLDDLTTKDKEALDRLIRESQK